MDFSLTEEQEMIRGMVREFAEKELKPKAAYHDETKEFPFEILKSLARLGLMGMNIPQEYGGSNVGTTAYSLAITEIAKGCAATAVTTSVTNMVAEVIHEFGTEEVKNKHLPKICSGEYPAGSFALTEPQAGSDAANIRTTAAKDGDSYVLNGQKSFITSGGQSGITVVWAVTDKEAKRGKGISAFVVEKGTPGFIIGKNEEKMGQRASSTNELFFEDCRIPKENLLGQEGDGFKISMMELDGGRIGIASLALGLGYAAIDYATEYAKGREQFGQPIANFQAIQWMVADSYTELDAAQLLVLRASFLKEKKLPFGKEASMAKLFASETAGRVTIKAIQILGGYGYTKEYPVERYHRDVIVTTLYEGTSEIQRHVIARSIFGRKQG
ncbi:MAG: acyl-CoA dehydrogenase [Deltaproteobacteria bacterium RBG_16_54_11]|jgi:butyryl-CoA dehydrogenase|nr:MAG: acyl-CoA dehydrogenase [Deltaproteobacteria bacterium RBG_16_54_11]